MQDRTLLRIANRIRPLPSGAAVTRMAYEEGGGFYSAWRISDGQGAYLLKAACENELSVYGRLNNASPALPRFYGAVSYYDKTYILLAFVAGRNLMRCQRADLVCALDAMIGLQDAFWNGSEGIGESAESTMAGRRGRRAYLPRELQETYDRYLALYPTLPRTLCHDDLLPFNLIVGDGRAVFIDWEHGGMLPYPSMLARLLAHGSEHGETPFYMTRADKAFALDHYYERLVKGKGIPYDEYRRTMALFTFYELTEWVYVYRKHNKAPDALYEYYIKELNKARPLS